MAKEQRTLTNREAVWSKTCDWGKGMDVDRGGLTLGVEKLEQEGREGHSRDAWTNQVGQ